MKVSVADFGNALALFEAELIGTFKTSIHKFVAGAAIAAGSKKIEAMLAPFVGEDGTVDADALRSVIDAGMKQCGGEFEVPFSFGILGGLGLNPVVTRITKMDIDKFFDQTLPAVAKPTVN